MGYLADILLAAGALGAGFYCYVLSRRLRGFTDLEKGVGGAVALLSAQVDDLTRALRGAQEQATASEARLARTTAEAEAAARRIELLVAAMHDLPQDSADPTPRPAEPRFVRHVSAAGADQ